MFVLFLFYLFVKFGDLNFTRDTYPHPRPIPAPAPAPATSTRESRPATFRHTLLWFALIPPPLKWLTEQKNLFKVCKQAARYN